MTIYAEKRKGKPTGVWIVEVDERGVRVGRARTRDYAEAEQIERDMKRGVWRAAEPKEPEPEKLTIGQLYLAAKLGDWKEGQSSRLTAMREVEWCIEKLGASTPVDDINVSHFKRLRTERTKERAVTPQSVDRVMASLSSLFTWGRGNVNPATNQPWTTNRPQTPYSGIVRERTQWFTAEDQERLIQRMLDLGYRAEAICCLVYGQTGMRAGELLNITADQIEEDLIRLPTQKNGTSDEAIPLAPDLCVLLRELVLAKAIPAYATMLNHFKQAAKDCGFPVNERVQQSYAKRKAAKQRKLDGESAGECGVDAGYRSQPRAARRSTLHTVGLHTLRHSTATRLIRSGENPAIVQTYMRHASWATTRKYLKLTGEPKRGAYEKLAGDVRGAGQILRGISRPTSETFSEAQKKTEENQWVGSPSRTRTCDHSINSRSNSTPSKPEKP